MMGETPPAFDLLFWNGDGTNLPGKMAKEYLRGLYQGNKFADGGFEVCGETVHLHDVKVPLCAIACETDHIAPWVASYDGIQQMGSRSKTFILSESGHIAGIVNPPTKKKYGHYTNGDWSGDRRSGRTAPSFTRGRGGRAGANGWPSGRAPRWRRASRAGRLTRCWAPRLAPT